MMDDLVTSVVAPHAPAVRHSRHVEHHFTGTAGLAEIAAGSIATGLGGYLAARSDAEHYASELAREEQEIVDKPAAERQEITDLFSSYGLSCAESAPVVEARASGPIN